MYVMFHSKRLENDTYHFSLISLQISRGKHLLLIDLEFVKNIFFGVAVWSQL